MVKSRPSGAPSWWNPYEFVISDKETVFRHLRQPDSIWVLAYGHDLPGAVYMRVGAGEHGLACTGLFVGLEVADRGDDHLPDLPVKDGRTTPVGANELRDIRIGDLLRSLEAEMDAAGWPRAWRAMREAAVKVEPRQRRRGVTDDELATFTEQYRKLRTTSARSPVSDLAEQYGIDQATAYRWLNRAKAKGLADVPATTKGKRS